MLWAKSDSDIYYNKTSDKAATKWVTSDLGYTLGGPQLSSTCSVYRKGNRISTYFHALDVEFIDKIFTQQQNI
jgi:hypothetical protein